MPPGTAVLVLDGAVEGAIVNIDVNADLIGYTFESDRGPLTVIGTTPWSPQYVYVESDTVKTVRNAAQLRVHKG